MALTLMRAKDFAAHRGVRPSAVSNWKAAGHLVWVEDPERPGKQLIDVEKSDLILNGKVDPTRGRPRSAESAPVAETTATAGDASAARASGMDQARLDDMRERTLSRRIENDKALNRLVDIGEYERRAGDMGRLVRERTVGVVRQVAERLAAESDPRQIIAILSEQFDGLFNQLADEIEAAASAEGVADAALAEVAADEDDEEDAGVEAAA